ncbi:hypothetical protein GJAV_G00168900 [Gymnothorax javanicus]|nr:hypothetical protein GJAV_G00168900 [Gymnothorax javanicus]
MNGERIKKRVSPWVGFPTLARWTFHRPAEVGLRRQPDGPDDGCRRKIDVGPTSENFLPCLSCLVPCSVNFNHFVSFFCSQLAFSGASCICGRELMNRVISLYFQITRLDFGPNNGDVSLANHFSELYPAFIAAFMSLIL